MTRPTPLSVSLTDLLQEQKLQPVRVEVKEGWNPPAISRTGCPLANDFHNYNCGGG